MTEPSLFANTKVQLGVSCTLLTIAFLLLNLRTLGWPFGIVDSPILLAQAVQYSPLEYFTSPHAYSFLSYNNFTPLVTASWDVDYTLFGLEPQGFRIHQLIALGILLGLIYLLLYQLSNSVLSTTLFCFTAMTMPSAYFVLDVMVNRHYIEGMIFSIMCFMLFTRYCRGGGIVWLLASAACYAVSITAKEVYIPLPGILFFLYEGNFLQRVRRILPFAITLALYLGLRLYIIGGAGGYSSADASIDLLGNTALLGTVMLQVVAGLLPHPVQSFLIVGLFLVLFIAQVRRMNFTSTMALLIGLFGLLLPMLALLPLLAAGIVLPRWVFAPAVVLILYLAYLCSGTPYRKLALLVYFIAFAGSAQAYYTRMQAPEPFYARGEGRSYKSILESDNSSYLLFSRFSQLAGEGYSVWVHIAKLHNGEWGTLPILHRGQLHYHDLQNRTPIPMGRKAKTMLGQMPAGTQRAGTITTATIAADTQTLNLTFASGATEGSCIAYIYGERNGHLFSDIGCDKWSITIRELRYQLRKAGYTLEETQFAIWPNEPEPSWHSESYSVQALLRGEIVN